MKILLPLSTRRVYPRATVFPGMRTAVLIAVVIAAVGGGASQGTAGSTPETELTISIWPQGRGTEPPERWTLHCNPAGGTVPYVLAKPWTFSLVLAVILAAAPWFWLGRQRSKRIAMFERQLYSMAKPFARRRTNLVCTDQYGGPQQAVIVGTHRGSRVWIALGMRNGCDISRSKRLAFLVPGFLANSYS